MFTQPSPASPLHPSSSCQEDTSPLLRSACRAIVAAIVAVALVGGGCCHAEPHIVEFHMPPATQPARGSNFYTLRFDTRTSEGPGWDDWIAEWKNRFPDGCCLIVGHGGTFFGQWCVVPSVDLDHVIKPVAPFPTPIEWLCEVLRHDHPTLPIVVIACNPDHMLLHVTNVYYPPANVWILPFDCDTWVNAGSRILYDPSCVGELDEFVHTPGGDK